MLLLCLGGKEIVHPSAQFWGSLVFIQQNSRAFKDHCVEPFLHGLIVKHPLVPRWLVPHSWTICMQSRDSLQLSYGPSPNMISHVINISVYGLGSMQGFPPVIQSKMNHTTSFCSSYELAGRHGNFANPSQAIGILPYQNWRLDYMNYRGFSHNPCGYVT